MNRSAPAALVAALMLFSGTTAVAQDVQLTSRDGSIEISGDLVDFDGEFYRVDTVYGILTVDGTSVRCAGAGCPDPSAFVASFMISGAAEASSSLMPTLLEAFAARDGFSVLREIEDDSHFTYVLSDPSTGAVAARIRFRVSTSDEGFADLLAEQADIAVSAREISATELQRMIEAGVGDLTDPSRGRVLALDALVPVVSAANGLSPITISDLTKIVAGKTVTWAPLGGADAPVRVHVRNADSGLSQVLRQRVLAPRGAEAGANVIRHASTASIVDAVAQDPDSFGIASFSELGAARAVPLTGSCGYRNRATAVTIKSEDYPLTAPIFIYTPGRRLPRLAREFLSFVHSPAAQPVIREAGFVDQTLDPMDLSMQGDRLANAILNTRDGGVATLRRMISDLIDARRLTVSFRFRGGSADLDAQSRANIALLSEAIERGQFDGMTVLFAGFSDGRGGRDSNRRLSERRAETVRDAVVASAGIDDSARVTLETAGYGEALPMACDEEAWGQQTNRRVEVWVK